MESLPGSEIKLQRFAEHQRVSNHGIFHSFETLQLVQIYRQQETLVGHLGKRRGSENDIEKWGRETTSMLQDYFTALQNLEWTTKQNQVSWSDGKKHAIHLDQHFQNPDYHRTRFQDFSSFLDINRPGIFSDPLRGMLYAVLPKRLAEEDLMRAAALADFPSIPLPTKISPFADHLARFVLGGIGGGFLLVPVIVMTFVLNQNWRLVISSIFVLGFATFISIFSRASNQEVLVGSAAYAAVLVVFLGVTTTSGQ
jgi:hypothetical protein